MTITYLIQNGKLTFKANSDGRRQLKRLKNNYQAQTKLVAKSCAGHGLHLTTPDFVGALTDSLIFGFAPNYDAKAKLKDFALVFWFPDYAIKNEWEILSEKGEVTFASD